MKEDNQGQKSGGAGDNPPPPPPPPPTIRQEFITNAEDGSDSTQKVILPKNGQ